MSNLKFRHQVVENLWIYRGQRVDLAKYKFLQTARVRREFKDFL